MWEKVLILEGSKNQAGEEEFGETKDNLGCRTRAHWLTGKKRRNRQDKENSRYVSFA